MIKTFSVLVLALAAVGVSAQTLSGVQVETPSVKVGQPAAISVQLTTDGPTFCGIRIQWGDGGSNDIKIKSASDIPYKATHSYAKAGDYKVEVKPAKVATNLPCVGQAQNGMLKVVAETAAAPVTAAVVPAAPASAGKAAAKPAAAGACPEGWKADAKAANKKTGAFMCVAKAGTPLPDKKPACPGELTYFENGKKGQLGCRP